MQRILDLSHWHSELKLDHFSDQRRTKHLAHALFACGLKRFVSLMDEIVLIDACPLNCRSMKVFDESFKGAY